MNFGSLLFLLAVLVDNASCGFRILALVPYSGRSHWLMFRSLSEELAKRGNDVTVVSHHPREIHLKNYRDISIAKSRTAHSEIEEVNAIGSSSRMDIMMAVVKQGTEEVCRKGLQHPKVQELIRSNDTYDLLITEIFNSDCFLAFVHKFKAPFVAIRTSPLSPWSNDRVTNPDNPSYIPNSLLGKPSKMGFWDRMENLLITLYYKYMYNVYDEECTSIAREHFGQDLPTLSKIAKNTSLILVNSHFVYQIAKPLVPGVKEVGGIHLGDGRNKPLPKDLDDWITGAKEGVIYFSLGSVLKSSTVSESKRKAFIEAFAEIPQRVIMKWDDYGSFDLPSNVRVFKWLPQFDVLSHKNVKIFISHSGMMSTIEAVYSGTPMISIPLFGDQPTNAALLQEKGFAKVIQYHDITKNIILDAIRKILDDPSYRIMAEEMSKAIRDRVVSPLEEAVYWVEYVARYKGAPFLRSPANDMPIYRYLLLDVIGALLVVSLMIVCILWIVARKVFDLMFCRTKMKTKTKMN